MHRHHRSRPPAAGIMQQRRGQRCLPVMGMDDVGHEARQQALADPHRHLRKRSEAECIVGPIPAIWSYIGVARPGIQMRGVEHQQVEPFGLAGEQMRGAAEQIRERLHYVRPAEFFEHGRIAGDQGTHRDALGGQRRRQRTSHIGEPAGLDQGVDFRCYREQLEGRRHVLSRSIIGWVIRQTPRPVRRKRLASASGSSPTTSPSGICTPRSMTTLVSRAERPIST